MRGKAYYNQLLRNVEKGSRIDSEIGHLIIDLFVEIKDLMKSEQPTEKEFRSYVLRQNDKYNYVINRLSKEILGKDIFIKDAFLKFCDDRLNTNYYRGKDEK